MHARHSRHLISYAVVAFLAGACASTQGPPPADAPTIEASFERWAADRLPRHEPVERAWWDLRRLGRKAQPDNTLAASAARAARVFADPAWARSEDLPPGASGQLNLARQIWPIIRDVALGMEQGGKVPADGWRRFGQDGDWLAIAQAARSSVQLSGAGLELKLSEWWVDHLVRDLLPAAHPHVLAALKHLGQNEKLVAYGLEVSDAASASASFRERLRQMRFKFPDAESSRKVRELRIPLKMLLTPEERKAATPISHETAEAFAASWVSACYFLDGAEFQRIVDQDAYVVYWMEERAREGRFRSTSLPYYRGKSAVDVLEDDLRVQLDAFGKIALTHRAGVPTLEIDAITAFADSGKSNYRQGFQFSSELAVEAPTDATRQREHAASQLIFPDGGFLNLQWHPWVRAPLGERATMPPARSRQLLNRYCSASYGGDTKFSWRAALGGKLVQAPGATETEYHPAGYAALHFGWDGALSGPNQHDAGQWIGWYSASLFATGGFTDRRVMQFAADDESARAGFAAAGGELSLRFGRAALLARVSVPLDPALDGVGAIYSVGAAFDTSRR